jgi:hypothetical protein
MHAGLNGMCIADADCSGIVIDPSLDDSQKCIPDCFYDRNNKVCVNECPEFYFGDRDTSICTEVECSQRKPDMQLPLSVCGDACFAIDNFTCGLSCPEFYEPNKETKFCELIPCSLRIPNREPTETNCGGDCFYTPTTGKCSSECGWFYKVSTELDGVCELLECRKRTPLEDGDISTSSPFVCGDFPCFLYSGVCLLECPTEMDHDEKGVCTKGKKEDTNDARRKSLIVIIAVSTFMGLVVIVLVIVIIVLCVKRNRGKEEDEDLSQYGYNLQINVCCSISCI